MSRDITIGAALLGVFGAIALVLLVGGCGGPPAAAQRGLTAAAVGFQHADQRVAQGIEDAAPAAREAALAVEGFEDALEAFDVAMRPWQIATRALVEARAVLRSLQLGLDAWRAAKSGRDAWLGAVACALPVLAELVGALQRARVDVPNELNLALRLLLGFSGGLCPEQEPEPEPLAGGVS